MHRVPHPGVSLIGFVFLAGVACGPARVGETPCSEPRVVEASTDITQETTWGEDRCSDYLVDGALAVEAALTIEPGVTVRFTGGSQLLIRASGSLNASGSEDEPIIFTGTEAQRGWWAGIHFHGSTSFQNTLQHVVVEYGGGESDSPANVVLGTKTAGGGASVTIAHATLRESGGHGLFVRGDSDLPGFTHNTVTRNVAGPVQIYHAGAAHFLDAASTYTGNDRDLIDIYDFGGLTGPARTWRALDAPYKLDGYLHLQTHLTIEAGTTIYLAKNARILVMDTGALTAVGTEEAPIRLLGDIEAAGSWWGIHFMSIAPDNIFEHVELAYGGGPRSGITPAANIALGSTNDGDRGQLTMTRSTVRNGGGTASPAWGLWASSDSQTNADICQSNTFTAHARGPCNLAGTTD